MQKIQNVVLLSIMFALTQVFPIIVNGLSVQRHSMAEQETDHLVDLKICALTKAQAGAVVSFADTQLANELESIKEDFDVRYHKQRYINLLLWQLNSRKAISQACDK